MPKVAEIATAIEAFAPKNLQEKYDNTGLQVGNPSMEVTGILICLDVTEDILQEAINRSCNMIVSHHPLLFRGLKSLTGADTTQRIAIKALLNNVAVYAAHTNLDATFDGVSYEMAHLLNIHNMQVLDPYPENNDFGIGVVGEISPVPRLEFLRKVKETFNVKALRFSSITPGLVIKRVALCGGSGASLIGKAIEAKADAIVTGDVKYHDFTGYGLDILIADIGHFESELCSAKIFSRILKDAFPALTIYFSSKETNPIGIL